MNGSKHILKNLIMEIACNHASNLDRFDSYLKICKDIGNISIKYQIYNSDFLCHHSYKYL